MTLYLCFLNPPSRHSIINSFFTTQNCTVSDFFQGKDVYTCYKWNIYAKNLDMIFVNIFFLFTLSPPQIKEVLVCFLPNFYFWADEDCKKKLHNLLTFFFLFFLTPLSLFSFFSFPFSCTLYILPFVIFSPFLLAVKLQFI